MPKKPNDDNIAIGKRLKTLRLAKGYKTLRDFAQSLGVNEATYRAWEKGDNCIPPGMVRVLQQRFKVDHNWIYNGDDNGLPHGLAQELKRAA